MLTDNSCTIYPTKKGDGIILEQTGIKSSLKIPAMLSFKHDKKRLNTAAENTVVTQQEKVI